MFYNRFIWYWNLRQSIHLVVKSTNGSSGTEISGTMLVILGLKNEDTKELFCIYYSKKCKESLKKISGADNRISQCLNTPDCQQKCLNDRLCNHKHPESQTCLNDRFCNHNHPEPPAKVFLNYWSCSHKHPESPTKVFKLLNLQP